MTRPTLAEAKARYVHRYTMEHLPFWAREAAPNGKFYAPQFNTDAEWYANTVFYSQKDHPDHVLADPRHCYTSGQTWPMGRWLDAPLTLETVNAFRAANPFTGYDGSRYAVGDRVELHPGSALWARGARFGTVVGSSLTPLDRVKVRLDSLPQTFAGSEDSFRKA